MSVVDMVRTKVKEFTEPNGPGSEMLNTAKSAVAHGLDGASKFVDEKTHGKYSSQITNGVGKAKEFLGEHPQDATEPSGTDTTEPKTAALPKEPTPETGTPGTPTPSPGTATPSTGDAPADGSAPKPPSEM